MIPFTSSLLHFTETNGYDKIVANYIKNDDFLSKFFDYSASPEGIARAIKSYKNHRLNREVLVEVLKKQYAESGILRVDDKVTSNISKLVDKATFTITTGHQLNIFNGPLYVFYKIVSVINLAEKLNAEFGLNKFVPVFWMATEDHDIEEISSINLFGKVYKWKSSWKGVSGKMPLNGIQEFITEVEQVLGSSDHTEELKVFIKNSYLSSSTLAQATRKWVDKLFGNYGLVIIDGNDSAFKFQIKDIIEDELLNQTSSHIINNTRAELEKEYQAQVKPREINLFYIGEDYRERIIKNDDKYKVLNRSINFSKVELLKEISDHPEKFSPNVVLRPIYQECILPNVAYVGGPAEIAYWLELKDLFNNYKVPMPALFLRSCAMIIDSSVRLKLEKFSICNKDLFLSADELIRNYIKEKSTSDYSFESSLKIISNEFKKISDSVSEIDQSLVATLDAEQHKVSTAFQSLEDKIIRSLKRKNETEVNQIRKLKEKLFPDGSFQERFDCMIPYYLKWGSSFIENLKTNLDPTLKKFIILEENEGK